MPLVEGEYQFTCTECDEGSIQVIHGPDDDDETGEPQLVWEQCEDCRGEGIVYVDEKAAAEWIESGYTPLRSPAGA